MIYSSELLMIASMAIMIVNIIWAYLKWKNIFVVCDCMKGNFKTDKIVISACWSLK